MIHHGDCIEVMRAMPEASVDAIVTDPPYGLEFMDATSDIFRTYAGGNPNMKPQGKTIRSTADGEWQPGRTFGTRAKNPRCRRCGKLVRGNGSCKCPDPIVDTRTAESANQFQYWCELWATECLRVLKPGGQMLAFGGTKSYHRLTSAVEDAGFEVRDSLMWTYDTGFPKANNLKPAHEPIVLCRKPFLGSVATNAAKHGTGALNLEACRFNDRWPSNVIHIPKAPKRERPIVDGTAHPTVKPLALMRWLVRLVTPPGGIVLDPFAGSGTTIEAALLEGMNPIGIEREAEYLPLIHARIARTAEQLPA